ncbi:MAG TPA: PIG-L family deacetylase [Terriglobales bacterium]|nr:PIG-L family deacetylase [Terriglobales bacterium]
MAHPDDEAVGCGLLLQQMTDPIVIFATDGAPRAQFFWRDHESRESYARLRAQEARSALACVGVEHFHFLHDANVVADQELFLNLECAFGALARVIETELPDAILTLAYEGGHPDHDACSFLAAAAGVKFELPIWEMPLYHRRNGSLERQSFLAGEGIQVLATADTVARKQAMFAEYASQAQVLCDFACETEVVRPAPIYDFSRNPHDGELNYEAWQWPMRGEDLCRAFEKFLHPSETIVRKREWRTAA